MDGFVCLSYVHKRLRRSPSSSYFTQWPQFEFQTLCSLSLYFSPCRTRRNVSFMPRVHNELLPIDRIRSIQLHIVRVSNRCDAERPNNSIMLTKRYRHTIHRLAAWMRMNLFLVIVTMIWSWPGYCVSNTLLGLTSRKAPLPCIVCGRLRAVYTRSIPQTIHILSTCLIE